MTVTAEQILATITDERTRVERSVVRWLPDSASHGTWNAYNNYRCGCVECCEAGMAYRRNRRERLELWEAAS